MAEGHGDHEQDFASMVSAESVDCLHADLTRCGGITGWLRAAAIAAAHGVQISGHCAPTCTPT